MREFAFVILGRSAALAQSAEGALDDPAAWEHDEALGKRIAPDHLQAQRTARTLAGEPVEELLRLVGTIGPDHAQPSQPAGEELGEQEQCAVVILHTGGRHTLSFPDKADTRKCYRQEAQPT